MDVVVTLPKKFGLRRWIEEGDPAGERWSGQEWGWYVGGNPPRDLVPGDRVYVVYDGQLIGYAPLIRVVCTATGFALVRGGDAVPVTIDQHVRGFQGVRYRWWERSEEMPFPGWDRGLIGEG